MQIFRLKISTNVSKVENILQSSASPSSSATVATQDTDTDQNRAEDPGGNHYFTENMTPAA
jgi:hypothetical protein